MNRFDQQLEKINQIINQLEILRYEIIQLWDEMQKANYRELKEYLFDKLRNIVNDRYVDSIIFVNDDNIKYIAYDEWNNGFHNHIIHYKKAYSWHRFETKENKIIIYYDNEYNILEDIIVLLKIISESIVSHADPVYFKVYYLLKKNYRIEFVKD